MTHRASAGASLLPRCRPFRAELGETMFSLLLGVSALFLAVFVSAILDPRWTRTGGSGERARADDGSGYVDDGIPQQRTARGWKWGSLIASCRASVPGTSPFARQFAT